MINIVKFISGKTENGYLYTRYHYGQNDESEQPSGTLPHYEYNPVKQDNHLAHYTRDSNEKVIFGSILKTDIAPGETKLISYDSSGNIANSIHLKNDDILLVSANGKIKLSNSSESAKKLLEDLIDLIKNAKTYGSPVRHRMSAETIQQLDSFKQRIPNLFFD